MKIVFISPKNRTVYNFRGDLIKEIVALGHEVVVTGPNDIDVDKIACFSNAEKLVLFIIFHHFQAEVNDLFRIAEGSSFCRVVK